MRADSWALSRKGKEKMKDRRPDRVGAAADRRGNAEECSKNAMEQRAKGHPQRFERKGSGKLLCGSDAADQVFLLGLGFGADGEGVEETEPKSEIEGFVLTAA